jgi:predicted SprT family Zn-dependent metalloprotease
VPEYKYTCASGHDYLEKRPTEMEQIYKMCQTCGADLTEIK